LSWICLLSSALRARSTCVVRDKSSKNINYSRDMCTLTHLYMCAMTHSYMCAMTPSYWCLKLDSPAQQRIAREVHLRCP